MDSRHSEQNMSEKISVVIPCKDDLRISRCLGSIDVPADVVISFNGSNPQYVDSVLQSTYPQLHMQSVNLPKPNLALALEEGIWRARNDWVLLMDSDCVFKKGAIQSFIDAMSNGNPNDEVYKGTVIFDEGRDFISRIIAKSRAHHTAEQLTAYKPPLALSRKIAAKIGGHFFNKKLIWREDADLDFRIREANIDIKPVSDGVIYHGQLTLKTDLRSTFRYGVGEAIADELGLRLTDVPRSTWSTFCSQGFLPAAYMSFRNRVYTAGYLSEKMKHLGK